MAVKEASWGRIHNGFCLSAGRSAASSLVGPAVLFFACRVAVLFGKRGGCAVWNRYARADAGAEAVAAAVAGAVLAEAEALAIANGGGTHADGFGPGKLPGLLWVLHCAVGGVAGEAPAERVAENYRELHRLAVAARGRLPPPAGWKRVVSVAILVFRGVQQVVEGPVDEREE